MSKPGDGVPIKASKKGSPGDGQKRSKITTYAVVEKNCITGSAGVRRVMKR